MSFKQIREDTLYRASLCRYFENKIYDLIKKKKLNFPFIFQLDKNMWLAQSLVYLN